jgi:hypothetical protein
VRSEQPLRAREPGRSSGATYWWTRASNVRSGLSLRAGKFGLDAPMSGLPLPASPDLLIMMMLMIALGHWLAWVIFYGEFVANFIVNLWLFRILQKQGVKKRLPWFVSYIAWQLALTVVGLGIWIVRRSLYVRVFWWMEVVTVALLVMMVRESLLRIFKGFESLLRWSVLAAVVAVLAYSAWKGAHAPPVQVGRLGAFILGAEFVFRWGIAIVSTVAAALMWSIGEPSGSREDAVITGAAVASLGFVAWAVIRWVFGSRFTFFAQYLPAVGYFIAAFYWIKVFPRPIPEFGLKELGMQPEQLAKELRVYREILEWIRSKLW